MADTAPPVRLYCFAHAGAGTSAFRSWARGVGPGVEPVPVLLPGRESRRHEARLTGHDPLVADLLDGIAAEPGRPFVMYGHSLGALVVQCLAQTMRERALPLPALIAVGACPPPDAANELSDVRESADEDLMDRLRKLGLLPDGAEHNGYWRRVVMPVLRDDLRLAHALRTAACSAVVAPGPLPVPLLAVSGDGDLLAPPRVMAGWRRWSTAPVATRTVSGGHFFVRDGALPRLLGRACRVVQRLGGTSTPHPAAHRFADH
ncbi:thioesterase [Streptomyces sp. Ru73]|uniref:thioesterase II family protein n=1 Tax=Streptomyces sp. Ru73 TaxID=2080748 RepID=UPI000CDDA5A8|nr:thioesterase domain-containing protein [Streptomyces sp. Ru73]POX42859.1 thioesterase [Streptomyces sp. Ru73]